MIIVSALWRRPELTRLFLEHTKQFGTCIAAVSPEDPEPVRHPDWHFVEVPNEPLSDKFNAAMELAREFDPDRVLILGSDDFINAKYVEIASVDAEMVMPSTFWFFDAATRRAMYARCSRVGAGRVLSKELLERCNWRPWESGYNTSVDTAMDRRLGVQPYVLGDLDSQEAFLCDVKTESNLWSYDYLKYLDHEEVDAEAMFRNYVPEIADDLLNA